MIKAILFDCDGLLFNTEQISQDMWYKIADQHGVKIPDDFFAHITGAGKDCDFSQYFAQSPGLEEVYEEERKLRFDFSFWQSFGKDALNKKGLIELLEYTEQNGYLTAVCSSSNTSYVQMLLDTVSNELHFDIKLGGETVNKGKPDPEIYLTAAKLLHVEPTECLVVEDSKQGILAGYHANMQTCWIPDTISFDEDMKKYVTYECDNLSSIIPILERLKHEL